MKRLIAVLAVAGVWIALAASPEKANTLSPKEKAGGWMLLFDGKSLDQWDMNTNPDGQWKAVDGTIMTDSAKGGTLLTKEDFPNFQLKVEFRTTDNVNSGVMLRNPRPQPAAAGAKKKGAARRPPSILAITRPRRSVLES